MLRLRQFIEAEAVSLSDIKLRLYPFTQTYSMDAPRRTRLRRAVVAAARRLFAREAVQQQLHQLPRAGDGDEP